MNLQPESEIDGAPRDQRNRHIIRFSQIDGAGIVYYPRYFEMLEDSFPESFAIRQSAELETRFQNPVRLGEQLLLEAQPGETVEEITVLGKARNETCFQLRKRSLAKPVQAAWQTRKDNFRRRAEVRDWMTGADGLMHLGRVYELTAVLMEEWFALSLKCPFATLQSKDGALVPTVSLKTEIQEMPRAGDKLGLELAVLHIGRSSLGLGITVSREGELLLQTRQTIVFVAHQDGQLQSVQIPPHLLPILNSQLAAGL
ncbi:MAG TPA: hypothetical protein VFG52_10170 [Xanthomonadales bacterium]|nr:hypothetical protein [Xanthomonadales bacterium]